MHDEPSPAQLAQAPALQWAPQHWSAAVHSAPSLVQLPTQTPPLHTLEQQSRAFTQAWPSCWHEGPQTSFSHTSPLQQPSWHA